MRLKDIIELIKSDVIDLTDGPFHVEIQADDGGTHVVVQLEWHQDSQKTLSFLSKNYPDVRILVMKIPEGTLAFTRIVFKRTRKETS
jgi:hypothetical protein